MENSKRSEMGYSEYQKNRKFQKKGYHEVANTTKNAEVFKVPTILKKGVSINQVLNKENGISNECVDGVNNSSSEWNKVNNSSKINPFAKEYEPKFLQVNSKKADQDNKESHSINAQSYNQNYPQLLKKSLVIQSEHESSNKELTAKTPIAVHTMPNNIRVIEKSKETVSWASKVMKAPVKIINNFVWVSQPPNVLKEQDNYLVVGVLGSQSCGKSTLLSHLAGYPPKPGQGKMVFESEPVDNFTSHTTQGVDMFITQERMILLDSQAVFSMASTAVLKKKKRFAGEKHFNQDSVDAQSLQLASFFLSVCNVVIVVLDWFIDDQIIKLLSIAEMLKPKASFNLEDVQNPHVVFALNRATESDWLSFKQLNRYLKPLLCKETLLRLTGMFERGQEDKDKQCNIILLPELKGKTSLQPTNKVDNETNVKNSVDSNVKFTFPILPSNIHPSYEQQIRLLRNTLLSLPKDQIFNKSPEKNWFSYASKAWDLVRSSQFISDYSRFLS